MDEFSAAPCDTSCRVATALVFVMTAVFVILFFSFKQFPPYVLALLPAVLVIAWGFSVRGYSIEHGTLIIQRPFFSKSIQLGQDLSVTRDPEAGKGAVKVAGSAGLFGYYGSFRSKRLGSFTVYATDLKFGVVVKTGGKTYVVSPDEPDMFITRLTESAG